MEYAKRYIGAPFGEYPDPVCQSNHPLGLSDFGMELSLWNAMTRGNSYGRFFVRETRAKDALGRIPLPGQTALTVCHHFACGAMSVEYSGSFPSRIQKELDGLQKQLEPLFSRILPAQKTTRIAILAEGDHPQLRWLFDAFYRLNLEMDVLPTTRRDFDSYDYLIVPSLPLPDDSLIAALRSFVSGGGNLLATFGSFLGADVMPKDMQDVFGITLEESTVPEEITLRGLDLPVSENLDVLHLTTARSLAVYDGPGWGGVPALTMNRFGGGTAAYLGCYVPENFESLLLQLLKHWCVFLPDAHWPIVVKRGKNCLGGTVVYVMNYSTEPQSTPAPGTGVELLSGKAVYEGQTMTLKPWEAQILEVMT